MTGFQCSVSEQERHVNISASNHFPELPEETTEEELVALDREAQCRCRLNGILVQLPFALSRSTKRRLSRQSLQTKDVDGFHMQN